MGLHSHSVTRMSFLVSTPRDERLLMQSFHRYVSLRMRRLVIQDVLLPSLASLGSRVPVAHLRHYLLSLDVSYYLASHGLQALTRKATMSRRMMRS